jgi:protein TonB
MSSAAITATRLGENQRLTVTVTLSLILHALLIFGVGFTLGSDTPLVPTLDVIFSHTSTPLTPQQADFLAQANQQGGGDHDKPARPREPQHGVVPQDSLGRLPQPAATAPPPPTPQHRVLTSRHGENPPPLQQPLTPAQRPRQLSELAREHHDAEMARLAAEIHLRSENYAKRPNRKFVSASTKEYAYANYMRAWVDRAERVGNLNYPDEARQRRLGGKVVITVGVRRDGSLESRRILVSSGIPMLDSAAMRIVQLAQPFPPLPKTDDDVDILQVTRTWLFLPDGSVYDDH